MNTHQDFYTAVIEDIIALLDRNIRMIDSVLLPNVPAMQVKNLPREKIFAEVCLFYYLLRDVPSLSRSARSIIRRTTSEACDFILNTRTAKQFRQRPALMVSISPVLLAAEAYGGHEDAGSLLRACIQSPAFLSFERPAFRYQEAIWLYEQVRAHRVPSHFPCSSSLIHKETHPCVLSRLDLYAKTHAVFFENDFGRNHEATRLSTQAIAGSLLHDLNVSLCSADWDLVGETLLALAYTGVDPSAYTAHITCLFEVFRKFSFVPSITFDTVFASSLAPADREMYAFLHSYHSTIVLGLVALSQLVPPVTRLRSVLTDHDQVEVVDAAYLIDAVANHFGPDEFLFGPLNPDWYGSDVVVPLTGLVDGYASRCYQTYGLQRALTFLADTRIPPGIALVEDTRRYMTAV